MLKRMLGIALILGLSLPMSAQSLKGLFTNLRPKRFGISMGIEEDRVMGFSYNSFVRMTGNSNLDQNLGVDMSQAVQTTGICESPAMRLQAIWVPAAMPNMEWHTALTIAPNRVDALTFYAEEGLERYNDYLTLNSWDSEIGVDLALIRRYQAGPFGFYLGGGTNLGVNFDTYFNTYGSYSNRASTFSFEETGVSRDIRSGEEIGFIDPGFPNATYYDYYNEGRAGFSQRVYLQSGVSATLFRRVELGMEGRMGLGYRYYGGGQPLGTQLRSWGVFARWVLK